MLESEDEEERKRRERLLVFKPPFHDWTREVERIIQEHRARQLQRDYETLKTIHDYSEKLEALQKHMGTEKQGRTGEVSEEASENQGERVSSSGGEGFEVEVDDQTIQGIDVLQDVKSKGVESPNAESPTPEGNPEANIGLDWGSDQGDLGSENAPNLGDINSASNGSEGTNMSPSSSTDVSGGSGESGGSGSGSSSSSGGSSGSGSSGGAGGGSGSGGSGGGGGGD